MGAAPSGRPKRRHPRTRMPYRRSGASASGSGGLQKSYAGLRLGLALVLLAAAILLKYAGGDGMEEIRAVMAEQVNKSIVISDVVAAIGRAVTGGGKETEPGSKTDDTDDTGADATPGVSISPAPSANPSANPSVSGAPSVTGDPKMTPAPSIPASPSDTPKVSGASTAPSGVVYISPISGDYQIDEEDEYLQTLLAQPYDEGMDNTPKEAFVIPPPDDASYEKLTFTFSYKAPLKGKITSAFGYRDHPMTRKTVFHHGMDIGAVSGSAIYAFAAGVVKEVGYDSIDGNYLWIEHAGGIKSFYGHCSKIYVKKGAKVTMGKKIAAVGSTGSATGPHLHFQLVKNGVAYNPEPYLA